MTRAVKTICKLAHITDTILTKLLRWFKCLPHIWIALAFLLVSNAVIHEYIAGQFTLGEMYLIGLVMLGGSIIWVFFIGMTVEDIGVGIKKTAYHELFATIDKILGYLLMALAMIGIVYILIGINGMVYFGVIEMFPGNMIAYTIAALTILFVDAHVVKHFLVAIIIEWCEMSRTVERAVDYHQNKTP